MLAGPSNVGDVAGADCLGDGGVGADGGADARFVAFPGDAEGEDDGAGLAFASRIAVGCVAADGGAGVRCEEAMGVGAVVGRVELAAFWGAFLARCSTSGSNCLSKSR